jgi:hypothetical protein
MRLQRPAALSSASSGDLSLDQVDNLPGVRALRPPLFLIHHVVYCADILSFAPLHEPNIFTRRESFIRGFFPENKRKRAILVRTARNYTANGDRSAKGIATPAESIVVLIFCSSSSHVNPHTLSFPRSEIRVDFLKGFSQITLSAYRDLTVKSPAKISRLDSR